jgi:Fe-S cluster assembly protein SufD
MTLPFAELAVLSRSESWKYTNLDFLKSHETSPAQYDGKTIEPLLEHAYRMVFVNGTFDAARSSTDLPGFLTHGAHNLPETIADRSLVRLNAKAAECAVIAIPAGMTIDKPLEILFQGMGGAFHNQIAVSLDDNAALTIVERHAYEHASTATSLSHIRIAPGATLRHYRLFAADPQSVCLATSSVSLGRDARYEAFSLITGGRLSRHEIAVELNGAGAEVHLNGAHVLSGNSHADTTTEIRHMAPHCASRETYRHVMDGSARSVFQGKIHVAPDAQKSDGFQLNQSLMLSPHAEVNAKPELEIYADDVKCSHGATSGRLDEEALFYLRSRGIPEDESRALLVGAFIGASVDLISHEAVREAFRAVASQELASGGDGNEL